MRPLKNLAAGFGTAVILTWGTVSAQAGIITPLDGTLTVHYNPDVLDPITAAPVEAASNIAWVEIADGVLGPTTPFGLPDYYNYGFNLVLPSPLTATAGGLAEFAANALTTLDVGVNPTFEFGPHGGQAAQWTIDYYSPETGDPVDDPARSRAHTVLFGSVVSLSQTFDPANDGTGGIPDIQYVSGLLSVDDGIYHSINNAEIDNQLLGELTYGYNLNYNLIEFQSRLVERNDGIDDDGVNYWDGSGRLHIPEPATLALMGMGLAGIGMARRRRG